MTGEAASGTTPAPVRRPKRWPRWIAALAVLGIVLMGWRWWTLSRTPQFGIVIDATEPAQDFTLDASIGRPVSLSELPRQARTALLRLHHLPGRMSHHAGRPAYGDAGVGQ